jgi:hypothetical protein
MSRLRTILSNFEGARFVAQFLPIAPQLAVLALLDAPSCVARLKVRFHNPFEAFALVVNWPKNADCAADTTCTGCSAGLRRRIARGECVLEEGWLACRFPNSV